ncbi:hypothetical protein [Clostridium perfringens]|jgi:hypothetical protein|uniref:Phage protein n=1 Tax=Clostridium perfringens TaxID=1502 RepID=A0AAW4J730_CLOPF|nr:hypothetical protein [Clostridium perfringens]MBO3356168.1 hypothetical protein [Clostridium perfringens]MBO3359491.1 hypothetical protein [Clostridium perfringens]
MTKKELENILSEVEICCEEDLYKIKDIFEENNVKTYKIDYDLAYDSCGYDVYYYCVAYYYDDQLEIITGTWDIY